MLLIGQYDSPFVRRVGIALTLYDIPFHHAPWSTFGEVDKVAAYPLRRVPTLVLDDGTALVESFAILDALDDMAEAPVLTRRGAERRAMLRVAAFAMGVADKGVSLVYEAAFRGEGLEMWVERCRTQIAETLAVLEHERAAAGEWMFGESLSHADIAVAVAIRFLDEALRFPLGAYRALRAHSARCETMPAFAACSQPFTLATN